MSNVAVKITKLAVKVSDQLMAKDAFQGVHARDELGRFGDHHRPDPCRPL